MSKNTIVISEYLQMKKPLQITSLNLSNQKLNKWPQEIFLCRNLRKLNLSKNQLDYIPKEISSLAKLRVLDLSDNNLSQIHTSVFLVPKLRVLNISNNRIKSLPKQFQTASINELILSNNCKHSVNHVFSSPTSIINFTSKKPSYDDTRRSGRDNELLQRAQNDL